MGTIARNRSFFTMFKQTFWSIFGDHSTRYKYIIWMVLNFLVNKKNCAIGVIVCVFSTQRGPKCPNSTTSGIPLVPFLFFCPFHRSLPFYKIISLLNGNAYFCELPPCHFAYGLASRVAALVLSMSSCRNVSIDTSIRRSSPSLRFLFSPLGCRREGRRDEWHCEKLQNSRWRAICFAFDY